MKTINLLAVLFFSTGISAQDYNQVPLHDVNGLRFYERFIMEAGMRIPMDNLGDKTGASPEFGMWVRSRLRNENMLDIGGTVSAASDVHDFDYSGHDTTYKVSPSGVSGMAGFRLAKVYPLKGGNYKQSIELMPSFGYAFFMYRDRYVVNGHTMNDGLKLLNTFHAGLGLRFTIDNLGFQANYNYTPYGQFSRHVPTNFGAQSFSLSLIYRQ